jgi:hypothetical protein
MITTISYNDFSDYYNNTKSFPEILEDFKSFVSNGGNLNLSVLNFSGDTLISFEKWLQIRYPNSPQYLKQLIDENLITNPFDFIIDHTTKTITDIDNYGLYWMKKNFSLYKPYILQAVSNLAAEIKEWDLGLSNQDYLNNDFPLYYAIDYNNKKQSQHYQHPLSYLVIEFNDADILQTILEISPKYHDLWQPLLNQKEHKQPFFKLISKPSIAKIFYKYNIGKNVINNSDSLYQMHKLISEVIIKDDVDFMINHIQEFNLPNIEQCQSYYDCFLTQSKSKTMAILLMNNNAFIQGDFITHSGQENVNVSCFREGMNEDTLDAILSANEHIKEQIITNPDLFFNIFFRNKYSESVFPIIKLLIEKYNFPVKNYDLLNIGMNIGTNHNEQINWFIEHGADPRKCDDFITEVVKKRVEGLKTLKSLQKDGIFNSFYPDPIFTILHSKPTKEFTNWLLKSPKEQFERYTIEGYPAWWGCSNDNGWAVISEQVSNFTQLSQNGLPFAHHYFSNYYTRNRNYDTNFNVSDFFLNIYKKMKKQGVSTFQISGNDADNRNLFHHCFSFNTHNRNDVNVEVLKIFLDNTTDNIGEMLTHPDCDGKTPLALMLEFTTKSNMGNVTQAIRYILNKSFASLDFDADISVNDTPISVFDICTLLLKVDNDNILLLKQYYDTWNLYHELNNTLTDKNRPQSKKTKL